MASTESPTPDTKPSKPAKEKFHSYPFWAPRFWHGMLLGGWWRLLKANRFAMSPLRWPMALIVSMFAVGNTTLAATNNLIRGRRIRETQLAGPPIFIIGHWRSGTTFLHELLIRDEQYTFPTTYHCFAPHHFQLTEWFVTRFLWFMIPGKRPMDNVASGFERPQEDEFALCNLGVPSPYLTMAFPNRPPQSQEYLDFEGLNTAQRENWKSALRYFLRAVTLHNPKRIVVKSPPHTSRIATLLEMYPDAQFIHIVRDPLVLFPSTVRLWKSLYTYQGFQFPKYRGLEEHVYATFERMYEQYRQQRALISPENLVEIRYEDLVADPMKQIEHVYSHLNLGGFDKAKPAIQRYVSDLGDYRTNRYDPDEATRTTILQRWQWYAEQYGYAEA
ncbi:MAG: sulfotransferase [Pirellulales bacterium]|nr:sulfotransferase [Pirellulales bacterium]